MALVENDQGLKGIIFSLACLRQVISPNDIQSLIEKSEKRLPTMLCLSEIYELRKEFGLSQIFGHHVA